LQFGQWVEACPDLLGNLYRPRLCLLPLSGVFLFMTFSVLKVDEVGYDTVEIDSNGTDITFFVHDESPAECQLITIPLADWPEVKKFIDAIYQKYVQ